MQFKVIEAVDYLDPKPSESVFSTRHDADFYIGERIGERVNYSVQHSSVTLSEQDFCELIQYESTFFRVEEIH